MKIAVFGGTGFVGSRLVEKLHSENNHVIIFTRDAQKANRQFSGLEIVKYTPLESGDWQEKVSGCDGVINLAGQPIADSKWTSDYKQKILQSRELGTRKIVEAIKQANHKPQVLVNSSAIGYYGTSETAVFDENSAAGNDFLAEVCQKWETEAEKVTDLGVRLVILRTGIVLGKEGGALAKMLTPFQIFAGGPLGTGNQWFSWIHRDDLVNLFITALKQENMTGTFNATAPYPVRMNELCKTLGQVMNRPSWLPVPGFALQLLLGEGAQVVLEGQQVLPKQAQAMGFQYKYPELKSALTQILN
jgi:uncharacterized protein (TIGR01777 family)